jgi:hypothetical protein
LSASNSASGLDAREESGVGKDESMFGNRFDARTRVVYLDAGQLRDREANRGTMLHIPSYEAPVVPFEALFLAQYRAIRAMGRSLSELGVAIFVVHVQTGELVARAWVSARLDRVQSAIIGRHSEADVVLEDPRVSLRHVALVLAPPTRWESTGLAYEVLDLRTSIAFHDERGRHLEAFRAEGPSLVSLGPYALFFLPTGDPTDWPELATDAWASLPERVFFDERRAEPDAFRRGPHRRRGADPRAGSITYLPAVSAATPDLLTEGERPRGTLRVSTPRGERDLPVGADALARGILLGRYERCEFAELFDEFVSRAHLLVREVGGAVVAVDTASTSGTFVQGRERRARVVALDRGEVAELGERLGRVSWSPSEEQRDGTAQRSDS